MREKINIVFCAFFMFAFLCLLTSCGLLESRENHAKMQDVRVGMTKDEVIKIMGEPLWNESYNQPNLWYYYTQTKWLDGLVTKDECSPFVFDESGKLEGFGNEYFNKKYRMGNWIKLAQENDLSFEIGESL